MPDHAKNMLIGIFVIAALAIVVFVLMFLHPNVGDEGKILRARFANIDKISVGTRVTFAGKPVGEVESVTELPDIDTERKAVNGYVYAYELELRVDSGVNVFNTDEIVARTSGLLGEKSVGIIPHPLEKGEELRLVNNEVIYANEAGTMEEALQELKNVASKFDTTLDNVNEAFAKLKKEQFWENLGSIATNISDITSSLNDQKKLSEMLANFHKFSGSINTTWATVDEAVKDFRFMSERIRRGEGSVGRLLMDEDLYLRTTALLSKGDTIMNDIHHYGLLFHMDKGWQRLRARRLNLLQHLSTPQEFRNYFNEEIDMITTSLERVSMVLEQVEGQPASCCYDLLQNTEFAKVYGELLRRVSGLEEEIKMYNQQVFDNASFQTELQNCWCQ